MSSNREPRPRQFDAKERDSFYVSMELGLLRRLRLEAGRQNVSKSAVISEAVEAYLAAKDGKPK